MSTGLLGRCRPRTRCRTSPAARASSSTAPRPRRRRCSRRWPADGSGRRHALSPAHRPGRRRSPSPNRTAASSRSRCSPAPPVRSAIDEGRADFVPVFLSDIPRLFTSTAHPARRRAAAAVAARSPRLLHARHVGRRRAGRRATRHAHVDRRDQRADAAHARQHARARRPASPRSSTPTARCHDTSAKPVDAGRGRHRRARRQLVAGRRDAADGHRRHPRRGAAAPVRQARPRRSTPRCSPTASSTSPRPASSPTAASTCTPAASSPASCIGTERVYDFVDDNPFVEFHPCDHTNDTARIRKNDNVVAINSALEVDLSGPGLRRLDRLPHLLGHRRPDGLHPRRGAVARAARPIIALPSTAARRHASRASCRRSSRARAW